MLPDRKTMYDALVRKDSQYEGVFVAGIRTTGIFCRPSCTARKPKEANVEYFRDANEAILNGFRPCKVCEPLTALGKIPDWLQPLFDQIDQNPDQILKASDLKDWGLDPVRVRRWFQKNRGMTFAAFMRNRRLNSAVGQLKEGTSVVAAGLDNGYESLSGFSESLKSVLGQAPMSCKANSLVTVDQLETPLGPMLAGATESGICLLEYMESPRQEKQICQIQKRLQANVLLGQTPMLKKLKRQLEEYFKKDRKQFSLPLHLVGTDFQVQVWEALQTIPYGTTRSYAQQATGMGDPTAVRAVANANGANRISILVPCHRVIGSNGKLTGYGGGLWRKQRLLELEGEQTFMLEM